MQTRKPKFEFLTDESIFSLSGSYKLTTWKDSNLQIDKQFATIPGGVLDGKIFGSCFEGHCNCGRKKKGTCGHCGAVVLDPVTAWSRFGRIDLPMFYCGSYKKPNLLRYLVENFKIKLDLHNSVDQGDFKLSDVIEWAQVNYKEDTEEIVFTDIITDFTHCSYDGLLKIISEHFHEKLGTYKSYINSSILVAPLVMRAPRYVLEDGVKVLKNNQLTIAYMCILNAIYEQWPIAQTLPQYSSEAAKSGFLAAMRAYINQLLDIMNQIVKPNRESLPRTMQAHRMNNSGRCTIIPSPQLKIDEVEIPRHLMYECCKDEFIQYMMDANEWSYERAATQYLTEALSPVTQKMFTDYVDNGLDGKGKYVIINRNPTLYELGMFCCRVKLTNDYTIGVPLGICSPMGGDFDGDTFSFYSVPSHMVDIMIEKMSPKNQFRYKKNQMPLFTPSHEVLGGLIVGTRVFDTAEELPNFMDIDEAKQFKRKNRFFKYQTRCIIDNKETTLARSVLGNLFNIDLDLYLKTKEDNKEDPFITSKDIPFLYGNLSDLDDRTDRIQQIQEFALLVTTLSGATTPSLAEMHAELPTKYIDQIHNIFKSDLSDDEKDVKATIIYKQFLEEMNAKDENNHYKYIDDELVRKVSDSARAKVDQLMLIMSPMFTTGPDKRVRVGNSTMLEGLSPTDYVNMAIENRVTQDIKVSATPRSGYTTRQLAYLGNPYKYSEEEDGDTNPGLFIPLKLAAGRTRTDGTIVTRSEANAAKKDELVKVRSVVTSPRLNECIVSKDCISIYNNWKNGDSVGISLMTSLTEGLTQSGLSLKHGGHLFELDPLSYIEAPEDCHLELTADDVILKGKSGKIYMYPRSEKFTKNFNEGDYYKKGDIVGLVYRLVTPSYRLDSIIKFIDAANAHSNKRVINNQVLMTDCYAFTDGEIHYQRNMDGKITSIMIDKYPYQFNPASCYFMPEGAFVKKGQRFCTGVMDLKSAIHHLNDYVEVFYLFYKQFNELIPNMTPELIEMVYALTVRKTEYYIQARSVIESVKNSPGSLNRLAFREPKQFFLKIDHKGAEFVSDAISSIVLPTILLNDLM